MNILQYSMWSYYNIEHCNIKYGMIKIKTKKLYRA